MDQTDQLSQTPIATKHTNLAQTTKQPKKIISKCEQIFLREKKAQEQKQKLLEKQKANPQEQNKTQSQTQPRKLLSKADRLAQKDQRAKDKLKLQAERLAQKEANEKAKADKLAEREQKKAEKAAKSQLPKKPKAAYFWFVNAKRDEIKKANPEEANSVTAIAKLMGVAWNALSDEEKQVYQAEAEADKVRYLKECEAAGIDPKASKSKRKKNNDEGPEPKRIDRSVRKPRTAVELYREDFRLEVATNNPHVPVSEIVNMLNADYEQLNEEEKKIYEDRAAKDVERFEKETEAAKIIDPDGGIVEGRNDEAEMDNCKNTSEGNVEDSGEEEIVNDNSDALHSDQLTQF